MPCLLQPIVLPRVVAAGTDRRLRYFVRCRVEIDAIHHLAGRFDVLGWCEPFILAGTFSAVVLLWFQPGFAIGRKAQLLAILVRLLQALVPAADLLVTDASVVFRLPHRQLIPTFMGINPALASFPMDGLSPPRDEPALLIQLRINRLIQQRPVLDFAGVGNQCVELCLRSTELPRAERHHSAIDACRYIAAHAATLPARNGSPQARNCASTSSTLLHTATCMPAARNCSCRSACPMISRNAPLRVLTVRVLDSRPLPAFNSMPKMRPSWT